MINAIIFDLDGTLINSEMASLNAWNSVLAHFGRSMSETEYHNLILGVRHDHALTLVLEQYALKTTYSELLAMTQTYWQREVERGFPLMPGVRELLALLPQYGLVWGIATASEHNFAEAMIDRHQLQGCLAIAGGDEVTHTKPAPDLYQLCAERLGFAPTACLAVEDSVPGHLSALSAGCRTLVVPHPAADLTLFAQAHRRYRSLQDIAAALPTLLA